MFRRVRNPGVDRGEWGRGGCVGEGSSGGVGLIGE